MPSLAAAGILVVALFAANPDARPETPYIVVIKAGPLIGLDGAEAGQLEPGEIFKRIKADGKRLLIGHSRVGWIDSDLTMGLYEAFEEIRKRALEARTTKSRCDLARVLLYGGDFDSAIRICNAVLERDPRSDQAMHIRAAAFRKTNNLEKSLQDADRVVDLAPENPFGYVERAAVSEAMRDYDGALSDLSDAITLASANHEFRLKRAEMLSRLGRPRDALADLNHVIERDPYYGEARALRALALWNLDRYEEANREADYVLEAFPELTSARMVKAWYLNRQHRPAEAISVLGKLIDEGEPAAYYVRGTCQFEQQAYEKAIADLNEALMRTGGRPEILDRPDLFYFLGESYLRTGKYEEAITSSLQSLKSYSKYAPPLTTRALAYAALGKMEDALDAADQAVKLEPEVASGYAVRSVIYARIGKNDLASADAARARQLKQNVEFRRIPGER